MPTISIELTDAEYTAAVAAYTDGAEEGVTVDAAYIKAKLVNSLTARVRNYDTRKQAVTYTSFCPS